MHEFSSVSRLLPGATTLATLGIDFSDSTQTVSFDMAASGRLVKVNIRPSVGEILRPVTCSEGFFINQSGKVQEHFIVAIEKLTVFFFCVLGKLKGMNEHSITLSKSPQTQDRKTVCSKIFKACNVASITSSDLDTLR